MCLPTLELIVYLWLNTLSPIYKEEVANEATCNEKENDTSHSPPEAFPGKVYENSSKETVEVTNECIQDPPCYSCHPPPLVSVSTGNVKCKLVTPLVVSAC